MSNKTPLIAQHHQANAVMSHFFGWDMPLHYADAEKEHLAVRQHAGIFDWSHLTVIDLLGAPCRQFLRYLFSNEVDKLVGMGKGQYSLLLNHESGILDEAQIYCLSPSHYRLIMNAGTRHRTVQWLRQYSTDFALGIHQRVELAMIAVQGPAAITEIMKVLNPAKQDALFTLLPGEAVDVYGWFFARIGYVGEDGLMILLPADQAPDFWRDLLQLGLQPCGLNAMESLRIESGRFAYGHEINESTTPRDLGLMETAVALTPLDRDFIGRTALFLKGNAEPKQQILGFTCQAKASSIQLGSQLKIGQTKQGIVTSVAYSPHLNATLGFIRVPWNMKEEGDAVIVNDEGQVIPVNLVLQQDYTQKDWI